MHPSIPSIILHTFHPTYPSTLFTIHVLKLHFHTARDRGRYSAYKNGSLGISTIDTIDDGDYQCIGVNKAGKTSVNIKLS